MLGYLANTLIFILVGVVISQRAFDTVSEMDWMYVVPMYIAIMVIRYVCVCNHKKVLSFQLRAYCGSEFAISRRKRIFCVDMGKRRCLKWQGMHTRDLWVESAICSNVQLFC